MATIRFNSDYNAGVNANTAGSLVCGGSAQNTTISGSNSAGATVLLIYKGSVPSFPSFTDISSRASDLLITFSLGTLSSSVIATTTSNSYRLQLGINTVPQAASAAGTATWFLMRRNVGTSLTSYGAMLGTVGVTGSGADLEVADTNITVGPLYSSSGVFLNFPFDVTF